MNVHAEDRFRLDRLAVEEVLGQRSVYENFRRGLETDNPDLMHQKKAQDARQMYVWQIVKRSHGLNKCRPCCLQVSAASESRAGAAAAGGQ
jgi:hypothetical protein